MLCLCFRKVCVVVLRKEVGELASQQTGIMTKTGVRDK